MGLLRQRHDLGGERGRTQEKHLSIGDDSWIENGEGAPGRDDGPLLAAAVCIDEMTERG